MEEYYCPVSARLSSSDFDLYTPHDTPIQRLEESSASLYSVLESVDLHVSSEMEHATDACFAAFEDDSGQTVLVSRMAYSTEDLERITDELLLAASRPERTGILKSMVTPTAHVILIVDYRPIAGPIRTADDGLALVEDLRALGQVELVHGGINDRFVNPSHEAGRRIFGIGLSEAYAAWRRQKGLALGDLRADPRFASPWDLRGEPSTDRSDAYALSATILSEVQDVESDRLAISPIQGINALFAKSREHERLLNTADSVPDRALREALVDMLSLPTQPDLRMWRVMMLVVSGLSVLMLLWLIIPSGSSSSDVTTPPTATAPQGVQCHGSAVSVVNGKCQPSEGYARCGLGTVLSESTGACVSVEAVTKMKQEMGQAEGDAAIPEQSPYIHPVLSCDEDKQRVSMRVAFSNGDLDLSIGERVRLGRTAAQCDGTASVVYYTGKPDLESRAKTTYREFRSSSSCGESCRESLTPEPTSIVYVPYIGTIERGSEHYLFFACCH